ncbi:MAG TPA: hypothetical protein DCO77_03370 [Nitrospiraceae bacterium]|nr:hypothetical protein [Nitrospiraceae bacterium]
MDYCCKSANFPNLYFRTGDNELPFVYYFYQASGIRQHNDNPKAYTCTVFSGVIGVAAGEECKKLHPPFIGSKLSLPLFFATYPKNTPTKGGS